MSEQVNVENPTRILGKWLVLARFVWLSLVVIIVGTYLLGVYVHGRQLQYVCQKPSEICHDMAPVQFTAEDMATLVENGFSISGYATQQTVKLLFFSGIWFAMGGLLFVRKSDEPMALLVSFFLVTFGTGFDGIRSVFSQLAPFWQFPESVLTYLIGLSMILVLALFPNGRFVPRWVCWLVIFGSIPLTLLLPPDSPFFRSPAFSLMQMSIIAGLLLAQLYRYHYVSTFFERRQTRWVVFGISLGFGIIIGPVVTFLLGQLPMEPYRPTWVSFASEMVYQVAVALIPISVGVAILRHRLFNIDIIIRKTVQYTVVLLLLGLIYFGNIITLQTVVGRVVGEQSPLLIVLSILLIAALFSPLRQRIQTVIDRRFYRRKYDAQRVLTRFARAARD